MSYLPILMDSTRSITSQFQRRLLLLVGVLGLIVVLLFSQLMRLSVVHGAENLLQAEAALDAEHLLPAARGAITDRKGRALARDKAVYAVAVPYPVIAGDWVLTQARAEAYKEIGSSQWLEMSEAERVEAARGHLPLWEDVDAEMWARMADTAGVAPFELRRRRDEIVQRVEATAAHLRDVWIENGEKPRVTLEEVSSHVILPGVPDRVAFEFREMAETFEDMLEVRDTTERDNRWTTIDVLVDRSTLPRGLRSEEPITIRAFGVADHLVGSVRTTVYAKDRENGRAFDAETNRGGYRTENEMIGQTGIEHAFEDHLRGERGVVVTHRDTGAVERIEAMHGSGIELTIDVHLQARIQAMLDPKIGLTRVQPWHGETGLPVGTTLDAAVVVLDIETAEILALVSMPTVAMGREMEPCVQAARYPFVNRPIARMYPAGSIVKPLLLTAAWNDGVWNLGDEITCTGHFFPGDDSAYRCWIYRELHGYATHGSLGAEEALGRSCNIFFYTLGDRIGLGRLTEWYRRVGVGQGFDLGLTEARGELPADEAIAGMSTARRRKFAISNAIGQSMTWTPLHAANTYATLARGGRQVAPRLLRDDPRGGSAIDLYDFEVPAPLRRVILSGLEKTLEEGGSASRLKYDDGTSEPIVNVEGVKVWAKTGTAQATAWRADFDCDGDMDRAITGLDHSWFVGLVGSEGAGPRYAISVIVDYGGSGGRTAGPIANQVMHALQDEGYLPEAPPGL